MDIIANQIGFGISCSNYILNRNQGMTSTGRGQSINTFCHWEMKELLSVTGASTTRHRWSIAVATTWLSLAFQQKQLL